MDIKQRHAKVQELRALKSAKQKEIELKKIELAEIESELFEKQWVKMNWIELENWLKENRPQNKYENNPVVISANGAHFSYCHLNKDNELNIGAYKNYDIFPRGKDLLVAYDFIDYKTFCYG